MNVNKTGADGTIGLALGEKNQDRDAYESVDGNGDTAHEAHSWSDREECDREDRVGYELRMHDMEARKNIPSHAQSSEYFFLDLIRGWLVLQRSGLSESSKKTVLRTRWVDRGSWKLSNNSGQIRSFLVFGGDRKRDRDRKMRAYVQGETDEWEREMHLNETATECAWNANESRDAWEQASWDEAGSWEAEEDQFEGSFADEEEGEAFTLAGTQLNEALASERNAKRTVA